MNQELLQSFIQSTQQCGIQTRIVECHIPIEFSEIHSQTNALESSDDTSVLQEYDTLGTINNDLIAQALHFGSKEKNTSMAIVLELLVDLQQRLEKIENHILHEKQALLPLQDHNVLCGLGHGVLCMRNAKMRVDRFYYVRFSLPNAYGRIVVVFARALTSTILQIMRIHSHNTQAIDSFIAAKEMEQLRQRQSQKKDKE